MLFFIFYIRRLSIFFKIKNYSYATRLTYVLPLSLSDKLTLNVTELKFTIRSYNHWILEKIRFLYFRHKEKHPNKTIFRYESII